MMEINRRSYIAFCLAGAAAAWPPALCAVADLLRTPYQRALESAICGTAPQSFLGHCLACWTGAVLLMAAAVMIARATSRMFNHLEVRQSRAT